MNPYTVRRIALAMPITSDGLHDVWGLYRDAQLLRTTVEMLSEPFRGTGVTHVMGSESRGFLVGGMVALELGVGFVPARKSGRYLPGDKASVRSLPDWEGKCVDFSMQDRVVGPGDRILIADDWYTTGNQARALLALLERFGAEVAGIAVIVDEGMDGLDAEGIPLHSLLRWSDRPSEFTISRRNRLVPAEQCGFRL